MDAATKLHNPGTVQSDVISKMDPQWRMLQLAGLISKIDQNIENDKGCQIWSSNFYVHQRERGLTRGPKYGRLKIKWPNGSKKCYLAHRLMWMLHHDTADIPKDMHVSHLCHTSLCINALHLSLEPPNINNSRQICKSLVPQRCEHHPGYPDCIF